MKIRNGFVSNSSSSSFIIGIAVVKDKEKLEKYILDNKINKEDIDILTFKEIKENKSYKIEKVEENIIEVESFNYSSVSVDSTSLKDDDNVLVYYFCGNEGDYDFYDDDDDDDDDDGYGYYEPNYDIDTDFFDKTEQKVIDMLSDPEAAGLENCDWTFGAERNG